MWCDKHADYRYNVLYHLTLLKHIKNVLTPIYLLWWLDQWWSSAWPPECTQDHKQRIDLRSKVWHHITWNFKHRMLMKLLVSKRLVKKKYILKILFIYNILFKQWLDSKLRLIFLVYGHEGGGGGVMSLSTAPTMTV
jgi:hypothetical protein